MPKYKLGDCLSLVQNGAVIKQFPNAMGLPITRIETLSNDRFNRDRLGYADIYDPQEYSSYLLDDKDILMSHINSRTFLGRSVLYRKQGDEIIIHGMNLLRLKTKENVLLPEYAQYYFKTAQFRKAIDGIRKDAINQSSFSTSDLKNIEIFIPPIEEQASVVKVLLLLDEQMQLQEQINQNLQGAIKQLFDYWFIQFDFPNSNGHPYKSSGGKIVWNEKLKRDIPEEWSVITVGELLDSYSATKRYETSEYAESGKYPIIDQGEKYIVGYTDDDEGILTRLPAVVFGDHSTRLKYIDFPFARGSDGTQILYSKNPSVSERYLFLSLSKIEIPNPGYSRHFKYLKELPLCIPSMEVSEQFDRIAAPFFKLWTNNVNSIAELQRKRDALLPLLMNGQIMPLN